MPRLFALLPTVRAFLAAERQRLDVAATAPGTDPLDTLFPRQLDVVQAPGRFKALLCGRRAGKTELEDRDLAHGLLFDPPGSESLFFALTAESARAIFWRPLRRLDHELKLGLRFDESKWTVQGPQRQILTVTGSETMRDIERKRGRKFRRIRGDEIGAMRPSYLEYLLQDVLEPTLMDDPESTLWLAGTPGPAPTGLWWEITTGQAPGWEVHRWTAAENPAITDYEGHVARTLQRWNWTLDTPKFRREYLAEWATDPGRIVFRYDPIRNTLAELPPLLPGDHWVYGMGMDFGVGDATACVVLAWAARYGRAVYVVDAWAQAGMLPTEASNRARVTWDKWRPSVLVGDVNGLGKPYQLDWNRRFPGVPMVPADKRDKRSALEFASDAMAHTSVGGKVVDQYGLAFVDGVETQLTKQVATLIWDEDRGDIQDGQDDDLAMALVYAWRASPAFANAFTEPPALPDWSGSQWQHVGGPPRAPTEIERAFQGAFRRKRVR